ncbi:MAG: hypothetical protein QW540_08105 [Archaeoglobaceae archaeon]
MIDGQSYVSIYIRHGKIHVKKLCPICNKFGLVRYRESKKRHVKSLIIDHGEYQCIVFSGENI